jgi:hypothetical protein
MMAAFLNALGIPNDEGRIDSESVDVPVQDPARLKTAADAIAATYPLDEVATYFLTLLLQDAATWKGLIEWLEATGAAAG